MNETTLLVSQFAGPIFIVTGLGLLLNLKYFLKISGDFDKSPLTAMVSGMAAMVLGLAIVFKHNLWATPQEVVVSLLGWGSLVKGAAFLLAPTLIGKLTKSLLSTGYLVFGSVFVLALGGYLSWVGFFA